MFITEMTIKDVPPFSREVAFKFDKRVNVFIGPNGSGKTTALMQLSIELSDHRDFAILMRRSEPSTVLSFSENISSSWWRRSSDALEDRDDSLAARRVVRVMRGVPQIEIPAHRVQLLQPLGFSSVSAGPWGYTGNVLDPLDGMTVQSSVDTLREEVESKSESDIGDYFDSKADNADMPDDEVDFMRKSALSSRSAANLELALNLSYTCAKEICREIIVGDAPYNYTKVTRIKSASGLPSASAKVQLGTRIRTSDPAQGDVGTEPLEIDELSAGTAGTLWWIRLVALGLLKAADYQFGWQNRPGFLLIDEIENHLHPTWQRRVIPALLDHFPGLQIFATTHSPFVVAGLKSGQVHLLNRDADGVVTSIANQQDIIGWTADEILRVFMGVAEPTDETTAQAAQQLRRLRDEGPRADEREENERQSEIARLRQIVDRAALSGPRAAEDARFLADLRSILHRYSQQQDLNQENG